MTDTESLLLSCSQEILHDYYEKNEITLLLAFMARDITWTGNAIKLREKRAKYVF